MVMKSVALITLLVVVFVATQAQAQLGLPFANVVNITGNVPCSVNGDVVVNGTVPILPFPNALVDLLCNGTVRGASITNTNGAFSITMSPITFNNNVTNLLTNCKAVVTTPLSACNATLPSTGTLQAPLRLLGNAYPVPLNISSVLTGPFHLITVGI